MLVSQCVIVFTRRCLITALNSVYFPASRITPLPAGTSRLLPFFSLHSFGTGGIEKKNASNNSFVVALLFSTAETCLPCHCLAMDAYSISANPAFIHHVIIYIHTNVYLRSILIKLLIVFHWSQQRRLLYLWQINSHRLIYVILFSHICWRLKRIICHGFVCITCTKFVSGKQVTKMHNITFSIFKMNTL